MQLVPHLHAVAAAPLLVEAARDMDKGLKYNPYNMGTAMLPVNVGYMSFLQLMEFDATLVLI